MTAFNFNAKQIFLTYPRCAEPISVFEEHFKTLLPTLQKYIICQETHQDGEYHIHAYLYLAVRLHTRSERFFDFNRFHPNVQAVRSGKCVIDYVTKGGDWVSRQKLGSDWVEWKQRIKLDWGILLDQSTTVDEFLSKIRQHDPKLYVLQYNNLVDFASRHFAVDRTTFSSRYSMDDFNWTDGMTTWYEQNILTTPERPKCLILVSPSRFGKTQWARCLGDHFYMGGMYNLEKFNRSVTYGVFDDIPIDFLKYCYKQWFGCQDEFETTDKYKRKRTIHWGKPLIYLCNEDQFDKMKTEFNFTWIEDNCIIQCLTNKLY